jgi:hypothetical protein
MTPRRFEKNWPDMQKRDLDVPTPLPPQKLADLTLIVIADARIPPHSLWIYIKTGLIPDESNLRKLSPEDLRDLQRAKAEWDARGPQPPNVKRYVTEARERLAKNEYPEGQPKDWYSRTGGTR